MTISEHIRHAARHLRRPGPRHVDPTQTRPRTTGDDLYARHGDHRYIETPPATYSPGAPVANATTTQLYHAQRELEELRRAAAQRAAADPAALDPVNADHAARAAAAARHADITARAYAEANRPQGPQATWYDDQAPREPFTWANADAQPPTYMGRTAPPRQPEKIPAPTAPPKRQLSWPETSPFPARAREILPWVLAHAAAFTLGRYLMSPGGRQFLEGPPPGSAPSPLARPDPRTLEGGAQFFGHPGPRTIGALPVTHDELRAEVTRQLDGRDREEYYG